MCEPWLFGDFVEFVEIAKLLIFMLYANLCVGKEEVWLVCLLLGSMFVEVGSEGSFLFFYVYLCGRFS